MSVENILTNSRVIFNSNFYCGSAIKRFQSGIWNLFVLYGIWCSFECHNNHDEVYISLCLDLGKVIKLTFNLARFSAEAVEACTKVGRAIHSTLSLVFAGIWKTR